MAKISFSFLWFVLFVHFLFLFLFTSCYAFEGRETAEIAHQLHDAMHTIQLTSLLPSTVCDSSFKANEKKSSLKVVHKYGPCLQFNEDKTKSPSHVDLLHQDQSRVNSIHSKLFKKSSGGGDIRENNAANIPAKDGNIIGSGNYIVTVGLGTPKKDLSLVFDTGSDLTWTQCKPCMGFSCYEQEQPTFDPGLSKTYSNISCSSPMCSSLESATDKSPEYCSSSTCIYEIEYEDNSTSKGFFGKETLTLTPRDVFPNFFFGCGQNNQGLFSGAAGLIGLGRGQLSLVSQTAHKYKKLFSYCLPSSCSTTGHLTFGKGGGLSKSVKFTPISTKLQTSSYYALDVTGISVGGKKLSIAASVFSSGMIIDSGTVITRLQPTAYSALRSEFRKLMSEYPEAPALPLLDTCYNFSPYKYIRMPKINFSFNGGNVSIDNMGIFYVNNATQVCLAFAPNSDDSHAAIFGNVQQKTLEVVYDVAGGRVGFAPGGCR